MCPQDSNITQSLLQYARFLSDLGFVCLVQSHSPTPAADKKISELEKLRQEVLQCRKCQILAEYRTNVVFGEGNPYAKLVFIGEAPGEKEDLQGRPFVGPAGALLSHYIKSIGFRREDVFIGNVIKCRPPNNRDPLPEEIANCEPFLIKQLEILQPVIICALGKHAAQTLLKQKLPISQLRGRTWNYYNIKVLPTFHPASLLYSPNYKQLFEQDFKKLRELYDELVKK
ncbi:MAG: uracil-DNA glycosylase [Candidatus Sumerlaeia bacterium]|nr:uracil-DNA glycosylase [Candidatus Sumerlaeia bacterium]